MEQESFVTEMGKPKYSGINLAQYHLGHHKFQIGCPKAGD
jgi:hypothetical protein